MGKKASSVQSKPPDDVRPQRRWPRNCAVTLLIGSLLVFYAPTLACRPSMRHLLLRLLVPDHAGHIELESLELGWRTRLEARGIRYRTAKAEFVAESATSDRTLLDLICRRDSLGHILVTAPQLTIPTTLPTNHPPSHSQPTLTNSHQDRTNSFCSGAFELRATHGMLFTADPEHSVTCIARDVSFDLQVPPVGKQATFRLTGRAGDPQATAHFSGRGTTDWPPQPRAGSMDHAHFEWVGIDVEQVTRLLAALGPPAPDPARTQGGAQPQVRGLSSGTADLRRLGNNSLEIRSNVEVRDFQMADRGGTIEWGEPCVSLSAIGKLRNGSMTLDSMIVRSESVTIDAAGSVNDCSGNADSDMAGSVLCDWGSIETRLPRIFSENIHITGKERRSWRLRGSLRELSVAKLAEQVEAEVATRIDSADIFGFDFGPIELAAHWRDGAFEFQPIDLSFQNGRIAAQPTIQWQHDSPVLTICKGRVIDHVGIDPKLCDGILRYADPLFAVAGNLSGHLSLELEHFEVPLTHNGFASGSLEGRLLLDDVEFVPDEALQEVLNIAGLAADSGIRTSQAIGIRLENGRVHHTGLVLPFGQEQVSLEGWVGLDHTLSVRVNLPVTLEMVGKDKRIYRLLHGQRIEFPVTGTLERPKVSQEALARSIQRMLQITLRDRVTGEDVLRGLLRRTPK